jgi:hypothetical protein
MTAPNRRWPRFGLRTMFVVVTVLSVGFGLWRRTDSLLTLADSHEQEAREQPRLFALRIPFRDVDQSASFRQVKEGYMAVSHWHTALAVKYRKAIWQPWLSIAPDSMQPPDPEPNLPRVTGSFTPVAPGDVPGPEFFVAVMLAVWGASMLLFWRDAVRRQSKPCVRARDATP